MNRFSIGQAWSYATGFFSGNAANHAIVLIGIGVFIPLLLQWLIVGNPMASALNPAAMGDPTMLAGMGVVLFVVSLISYVLQFGSYFCSWRLGFSGNADDLAGGLRYGSIAGGALVALLIAVAIVAALIAFAVSPWLAFPFILAVLLIFMILYPALFGFFAILLLVIAAISSFAFNSMPMTGAAAMAGSGFAILLFLAVGFLMLWLAARLSCTAPAMADSGNILPFDAMKRSWLMTSQGQWRIVGYFLLIGVCLIVLDLVVVLLVGASFQSMMKGGAAPGFGVLIVTTLFIGIPMAYFTVAIPAGIYRALGGQVSQGDIFA